MAFAIHRGYVIALSPAFTMDECFAVDHELIVSTITRQDDGNVWRTGVHASHETHDEVVAMLKQQIDAHLGPVATAEPDRRPRKPRTDLRHTRA
ncbi:MAG TPA: hypothetical protein VGH34_12750 [Vicinamibacterales bacterium]